MPADEVNLYARHEAYLLALASASQAEIPVCVISGYLGSGKTTLVSHLLRNRGGLRLAVLINEVGQVDIDSQLLGTSNLHAEVGVLPILHTPDISSQSRPISDRQQHSNNMSGSQHGVQHGHSDAHMRPGYDSQRMQNSGLAVKASNCMDMKASSSMDMKTSSSSMDMTASSSLAGGCICCTASEGLEAALKALKQMGSGQAIEYLVVETSGVADPEPLAAVMARNGFRLESVVAVVDAEAGTHSLDQPVAQSQVQCADVVVVNKCDVASLAVAADVEDKIQQLSPGVRMLRARYGQVPLQAVLDVEEAASPSTDVALKADRIQGEVGFLSHEAVITVHAGPRYRPAGRLSKLARTYQQQQQRYNAQQQQQQQPHNAHQQQMQQEDEHQQQQQQHNTHQQQQPHMEGQHAAGHLHPGIIGQGQHGRDASGHAHMHPHASLHEGYHTVSVVMEQPLCLAAFQAFAALLTCLPGVIRAKGILWFQQLRRHRCIFHLSGRQRVECVVLEPWSSPPNNHMVIIGSDAALLNQLQDIFLALAAAGQRSEPQSCALPGESVGIEKQVMGASATSLPQQVAAQLKEMHERLTCQVISGPSIATPSSTDPGTSARAVPADSQLVTSGSVVVISVEGEPLHGVRGSEVNAAIMRRAAASMATTGHLILGVPEAACISAASGLSTSGDRMRQLLLLPDTSNPLLLSNIRNALATSGKQQLPACGQSTGGQGTGGQGTESDAVRMLQVHLCQGAASEVDGQQMQAQLSETSSNQVLAAGNGQLPAKTREEVVAAVQDQLVAWLWQSAVPALRKAFPHTGCRCDVVGLMHTPA